MPEASKKKIQTKLINIYLDFLRNFKGNSEATVRIRRAFVAPFLSEISNIATPEKLHRLSPKIIHEYIVKTSEHLNRASKKHLTSSLRSFLEFAYISGYLKINLSGAVPVIPTRKLEGIPKKISWDDVEKLLAAPDRKTSAGRRDYAILLLIASYGVRIGQIKDLTLNDIRWHQGIISFSSHKRGKPLSFPLNGSVAKALLEYIKKDRGNVPFKKVFLTVKGTKRPLSFHNHLHTSLSVYYRHAGIKSEVMGSHAIRHAFATRLMEKRIPIKTISDLLGHKCIDTTFIYTKVDIEKLRILAKKWPEEVV